MPTTPPPTSAKTSKIGPTSEASSNQDTTSEITHAWASSSELDSRQVSTTTETYVHSLTSVYSDYAVSFPSTPHQPLTSVSEPITYLETSTQTSAYPSQSETSTLSNSDSLTSLSSNYLTSSLLTQNQPQQTASEPVTKLETSDTPTSAYPSQREASTSATSDSTTSLSSDYPGTSLLTLNQPLQTTSDLVTKLGTSYTQTLIYPSQSRASTLTTRDSLDPDTSSQTSKLQTELLTIPSTLRLSSHLVETKRKFLASTSPDIK